MFEEKAQHFKTQNKNLFQQIFDFQIKSAVKIKRCYQVYLSFLMLNLVALLQLLLLWILKTHQTGKYSYKQLVIATVKKRNTDNNGHSLVKIGYTCNTYLPNKL